MEAHRAGPPPPGVPPPLAIAYPTPAPDRPPAAVGTATGSAMWPSRTGTTTHHAAPTMRAVRHRPMVRPRHGCGHMHPGPCRGARPWDRLAPRGERSGPRLRPRPPASTPAPNQRRRGRPGHSLVAARTWAKGKARGRPSSTAGAAVSRSAAGGPTKSPAHDQLMAAASSAASTDPRTLRRPTSRPLGRPGSPAASSRRSAEQEERRRRGTGIGGAAATAPLAPPAAVSPGEHVADVVAAVPVAQAVEGVQLDLAQRRLADQRGGGLVRAHAVQDGQRVLQHVPALPVAHARRGRGGHRVRLRPRELPAVRRADRAARVAVGRLRSTSAANGEDSAA